MCTMTTDAAPADRYAILGRLAGGVAHDLNNFFAAIDLSLEIVARRYDRTELEGARAQLHSAMALTRTLVAYARGGKPEHMPVALAPLVRRTLTTFRRLIPAGVELVLDASERSSTISGVPAELEQLLLNLVLNSCDAMPAGGCLWVSVRTELGAVSLEVADTGSGMTETPATCASRGEGLGLGVVRSVAERHDAVVVIVPRTGGGTLVAARFPRR
jgi:signal transduction histidine kinase